MAQINFGRHSVWLSFIRYHVTWGIKYLSSVILCAHSWSYITNCVIQSWCYSAASYKLRCINLIFCMYVWAVRQPSITWTNADSDMCHCMMPLGHNELNKITNDDDHPWIAFVRYESPSNTLYYPVNWWYYPGNCWNPRIWYITNRDNRHLF